MLRACWQLCRPHQYVKNLLIFAPLFWARQLANVAFLLPTIIFFVSFSLMASTCYILNDLVDRERDRQHPIKSKRPLAAGTISPVAARVLMILLLVTSLILLQWLPESGRAAGFVILLGYLTANVAYSFFLKNVVIVDILLVALFYLLRASCVGFVLGITLSPWFITCTFFLALLLVCGKRWTEAETVAKEKQRSVLREYPEGLLYAMVLIAAALSIFSYFRYSFSVHAADLFGASVPVTSIFVVYGVFRYLALMFKKELTETPEVLLFRDFPSLINVVFWLLSFGVIFWMRVQ